MNNEKNNLPLVALLGRANVGKSTLFNCLTEKQQALVSDVAGTTRDSNFGYVSWNNRDFELVDTAGIFDAKHLNNDFKKSESTIDFLSQQQVRKILDDAAIIIFMVDNRAGLLTEDRHLAAALKKNPELLKKLLSLLIKLIVKNTLLKL